MKHKLLFAAAGVALLAPTMAAAQDSGVYIKGQLGYGVHEDSEFTAETPVDPVNINAIVGDVAGGGDLTYALGIGYDFGNGWRLELDGNSLFTDFGTVAGQPASFAKLRTTNLMLNAIYDFNEFGRWSPYIGAGLGFSNGEVKASVTDILSPVVDNNPNNDVIRHPQCLSAPFTDEQARSCEINEDDRNLAWNLILGLGYEVTPNLDWVTDYRYTNMGDFNPEGELVIVDGSSASILTQNLRSDLEDVASHAVMTGFRYRFGGSTPPPVVVIPEPEPVMFTCWDGSSVTDAALCPPEPAPEPVTFTCEGSNQVVTDLALCPPRTECPDGSIVYGPAEFCPTISGVSAAELCANEFRQEIIYYEFDRGQSAETRNTINRILDVGAFCQVDNIRVVGHTDTSGSAAYNLRLSQRRAQDAVDELIRQGINRNVISAEGKGETEPFVQTGDGVKEQLNRRTEVLIQLSDVGVRDMSTGN